MATRDQIDDMLGELHARIECLEDPDLYEEEQDVETADLLRRVSVMLIQEHQTAVNEAYRSRGFKPWMRSSRMRQ